MDDYYHMLLLLVTSLYQVPAICSLYELKITSNGSIIVGDELHLSCSVEIFMMQIKDNIMFTWEKVDDAGSGDGIMIGFDGTITLNPVQFSDRGKYVCSALFNTSDGTIIELFAEYHLTVQFPPLSIQISFNSLPPFFVGEQIILICQIKIKQNVNIPFSTTTIWSRENSSLKVGVLEDSMMYNFTLKLHALDTVQSCIYTCEVLMQSLVNDPFIKGVQFTHNVPFTVYDYPVIHIKQSGIQNIGSSYRLSCILDVDPVVNPHIVWKLDLFSASIKQINKSIIYFDTLKPQDAGIYTCNALVNERTINTSITLLLSTPYNITLRYFSSFYIGLSWYNPLSSPSSLTNFTLTAISNSITHLSHTIPASQDSYTYNVTGLSPYQNITVILTANTIVDEGIPVSLIFQTDEYTPGPVQLLYIRVINNVSVLINWSHVAENQTNGVIRQYKVTVLHMGKVIYSEYLSSNVFSTIVNGLAGQIRYTAEVKALNSRVGIPTYAMFYTVEGVLPPPENISVSRLNGTHMIVSWTYVTDNRGFVETYQVMYGEGLFKAVSNSINTIVIGGLDPGTVYTVRIAVINSEGIIGEWSDPVTHEMSRIIQLRGGPFKSCTSWSMQDKESITLFFQRTLHDVITKYCTCTVHVIFFGEILSCDNTTPTNAIYRGNITGISPYSSDQLITIIEKWISSGANATSGVALIAFDPTCPVAIETIDDPLCTDNKKRNMSDDTNVSLLWSVLSPTIILLCSLIIGIIIIVLILWRRSKRIQTWSFRSCETPLDLQWMNEQCVATNTLYLNQNVHHEEFDEVRCNEEEEEESGVYDPSNLTVIYESDDSNIETL